MTAGRLPAITAGVWHSSEHGAEAGRSQITDLEAWALSASTEQGDKNAQGLQCIRPPGSYFLLAQM